MSTEPVSSPLAVQLTKRGDAVRGGLVGIDCEQGSGGGAFSALSNLEVALGIDL